MAFNLRRKDNSNPDPLNVYNLISSTVYGEYFTLSFVKRTEVYFIPTGEKRFMIGSAYTKGHEVIAKGLIQAHIDYYSKDQS